VKVKEEDSAWKFIGDVQRLDREIIAEGRERLERWNAYLCRKE